jgi:RNA polymerase sporulation-specific sigma factor
MQDTSNPLLGKAQTPCPRHKLYRNPLRGKHLKAFLKPLSISQEKYYLQKYQEGDSQAKNILIEHNLRLVAHVVKKYQGTGEDTDDLISVGTIGLIKAVTTFNPQKASRLSTYSARCIENELLMYFRSKKKHSREVSLYEPIGTDKEGNEINLLDVIESTPVDIVEDCYIRENTSYLLKSLKRILSDKEYQVICYRYGLFGMEEETQREIAQKLCISRSYVSRIEKTALQKLRGLFPQMQ